MTVRVGVIGVGNIGTSHARNLARSVAGSEVTMVFDADRGRASQLGEELGAEVVDTAEQLIASDAVDAVLIASPDAFHSEQAMMCLAAAKPTLCEKPLAPDESDARRVIDAEVALGRRLITMGFMRRFDPGYVALKAELASGAVGVALMVHNVHRNTRAPYGLTSAGTLTNSAIHEMDINRWLLDDEYTSVTVLTGRPAPNTPAGEHDPLLIVFESAAGVLVEIEAFVNAGYGYEVQCDVVGSEGTARMGDGSYITLSRDGRRGQGVPELWLGGFQDAYRLQLQAWIDHLLGRVPPVGASAWDGYVGAIVANRAIEALRTGSRVPITLPDRPALY